ncbi:hypothetical protein L6R46_15845 [Myxococcota bacterium]|nr:hypothetical protein [Myxococcota bacterium]
MLHRQWRLDAAFFEGLRELVPNRAPEIQALAEGAPSSPLPSSPPASVARAAPVQIRQDEITGGVGVQVKGGFAKEVDVTQRVVRGGTGVLLGDDRPQAARAHRARPAGADRGRRRGVGWACGHGHL